MTIAERYAFLSCLKQFIDDRICESDRAVVKQLISNYEASGSEYDLNVLIAFLEDNAGGVLGDVYRMM